MKQRLALLLALSISGASGPLMAAKPAPAPFTPSAACPLPSKLKDKTPEQVCRERNLLNSSGLPDTKGRFLPSRCLIAAKEKQDDDAGFMANYLVSNCDSAPGHFDGCKPIICEYLYQKYKQKR